MLALLLGCAALAGGDDPTSATVEEVDMDAEAATVWTLRLPRPAMVVAGCTTGTRRVEYGPSDDIDVAWYDGSLVVTGSTGEGYEGCTAWVAR